MMNGHYGGVMYVHVCECVHACHIMCVRACVYVCVCAGVCECVCVHIPTIYLSIIPYSHVIRHISPISTYWLLAPY